MYAVTASVDYPQFPAAQTFVTGGDGGAGDGFGVVNVAQTSIDDHLQRARVLPGNGC